MRFSSRARKAHTRLFTVCLQVGITCPHLTAWGTLGLPDPRALRPRPSQHWGQGGQGKASGRFECLCFCSPQTPPLQQSGSVSLSKEFRGEVKSSQGFSKTILGFPSDSLPPPVPPPSPGCSLDSTRDLEEPLPLDSDPQLHLPLQPYAIDFSPQARREGYTSCDHQRPGLLGGAAWP